MLLQNAFNLFVLSFYSLHCKPFVKEFSIIFFCAESGNISYFPLKLCLENWEFLFSCDFLHCAFYLITEMEILY